MREIKCELFLKRKESVTMKAKNQIESFKTREDDLLVKFLKTHSPSIDDVSEAQSKTIEQKLIARIKQDSETTYIQKLLQDTRLWMSSKVFITLQIAGFAAAVILLFTLDFNFNSSTLTNSHTLSKSIDNAEVESYLEENWTSLLSENDSGLWGNEVDEIYDNY